MRGVGRVARAMERDAQRAHRQNLAELKARARRAMLASAAEAAEAHRQLVSQLTDAHRVPFEPFERRDWHSVAGGPEPAHPDRRDRAERAAADALAAYRPGWFARTFGLEHGTRARLEAAVTAGRAADDAAHGKAVAAASADREQIAHARAVIALEGEALTRAVNEHAVIDAGAVEAATLLVRGRRVLVIVDAADLEDMPTESVTLLASGKASVKPMARSKVLELHRDSVFSGAIRVAAEMLKALPIDEIEVVAHTDLLDRATGHIEAQPVLYLKVAAQALGLVNLARAEPAPLVERLGGEFRWTRKDGFRPIGVQAFRLPQDVVDEYGW